MAIDYQGLVMVQDIMKRTVMGADKLKAELNIHDEIEKEIFEKLKKYLPEATKLESQGEEDDG